MGKFSRPLRPPCTNVPGGGNGPRRSDYTNMLTGEDRFSPSGVNLTDLMYEQDKKRHDEYVKRKELGLPTDDFEPRRKAVNTPFLDTPSSKQRQELPANAAVYRGGADPLQGDQCFLLITIVAKQPKMGFVHISSLIDRGEALAEHAKLNSELFVRLNKGLFGKPEVQSLLCVTTKVNAINISQSEPHLNYKDIDKLLADLKPYIKDPVASKRIPE